MSLAGAKSVPSRCQAGRVTVLGVAPARPVEARYWIGADYPEGETYTGELIFVDNDQKPQKIADVGRVTFSEGVRMAAQIFAKRKVEKEEGDDA